MTTSRMTRRGLVAAAAVLSAAPAALAATTLSKPASTTIGALWADAEILRTKLEAHRIHPTRAAG